MNYPRIIPCLLISGNGLVKTYKFKNEKYVGDPINAIRIFNQKEVDELVVLDIKASSRKEGPNFKLIEQIASECFMPLCYGGGIRDMSDVDNLFSLGIEKVSLQSILASNPALIEQIACKYGQQSVVVSLDIKYNFFKRPRVFSKNNFHFFNSKNLKIFIENASNYGAGEILMNCVDKDGTMLGMDYDLINEVSCLTDLPLIAVGGVGSLSHIRSAVDSGASAVGVGSYFVFQGPHKAVLITYPNQSEIKILWKN